MDRPIEFRAWDKQSERMGAVASIEWNPDFTICRARVIFPIEVNGFPGTEELWIPGDRLIVMQFTGPHDRDGKKLFQGDILRKPNGLIWEIYWSERYLQWYSRCLNVTNFVDPLTNREVDERAMIIGNIFENAALREGEHENPKENL